MLGYDNQGQLGSSGSYTYAPRAAQGLPGPAERVVAGSDYTCALLAGGAVWCWRSNTDGALGDGGTAASALPKQVTGLDSGVTEIAGGFRHVCAVRGGKAYCWGSNQSGQLGNGAPVHSQPSRVPVEVLNLTGITSIAGGRSHTCAVAGGKVWCWGSNQHGALGNGSEGGASGVPVRVGPEPVPARVTVPAKAQRSTPCGRPSWRPSAPRPAPPAR